MAVGSAFSQDTAKEIFRKALAAAGGSEAFQKIENFRIKSQSEVFNQQTTMQLSVTETTQLPDKTKQVMVVEQGVRILVLNGAASWQKIKSEIQALSPAQKREMQRGLFQNMFNVFKNYERDELRIEYFGEESVAGIKQHILRIKNATGDYFNIYVDAQTFLIAKKTYQGTSALGLAILAEIYSDYREIDGIMLPFRTEVRANAKKFIDSTVIEAELNVELSADFFFNN